ncbi:hypothetical protein BDZ91DRAFT_712752 [Kalaharituber pfeilii]|nr:hypothetical protein BDZ91DRAFT_712752 [Kalaharituber pfeilii]
MSVTSKSLAAVPGEQKYAQVSRYVSEQIMLLHNQRDLETSHDNVHDSYEWGPLQQSNNLSPSLPSFSRLPPLPPGQVSPIHELRNQIGINHAWQQCSSKPSHGSLPHDKPFAERHEFTWTEVATSSKRRSKPQAHYEKKARHKMREDPTCFEEANSTHRQSAEIPRGQRSAKNSNKTQGRKSHKMKGLMENFTIKDSTNRSRLTLKPQHRLGLFKNGRASTAMEKRGLPDLTFCEMAFLQRANNKQAASSTECSKVSSYFLPENNIPFEGRTKEAINFKSMLEPVGGDNGGSLLTCDIEHCEDRHIEMVCPGTEIVHQNERSASPRLSISSEVPSTRSCLTPRPFTSHEQHETPPEQVFTVVSSGIEKLQEEVQKSQSALSDNPDMGRVNIADESDAEKLHQGQNKRASSSLGEIEASVVQNNQIDNFVVKSGATESNVNNVKLDSPIATLLKACDDLLSSGAIEEKSKEHISTTVKDKSYYVAPMSTSFKGNDLMPLRGKIATHSDHATNRWQFQDYSIYYHQTAGTESQMSEHGSHIGCMDANEAHFFDNHSTSDGLNEGYCDWIAEDSLYEEHLEKASRIDSNAEYYKTVQKGFRDECADCEEELLKQSVDISGDWVLNQDQNRHGYSVVSGEHHENINGNTDGFSWRPYWRY